MSKMINSSPMTSNEYKMVPYSATRQYHASLRGFIMMTSSKVGNFSRATGPLWGDSTGHRWIPLTKARDSDVFFDLRLNKRRRL